MPQIAGSLSDSYMRSHRVYLKQGELHAGILGKICAGDRLIARSQGGRFQLEDVFIDPYYFAGLQEDAPVAAVQESGGENSLLENPSAFVEVACGDLKVVVVWEGEDN